MAKSLLTRQDISALERHLRLVDPGEMKEILAMTSAKRSYNRVNRNGKPIGKSDVDYREVMAIPHQVYFDKRFEHLFDTTIDRGVRDATMRHLRKEFSKFSLVDK